MSLHPLRFLLAAFAFGAPILAVAAPVFPGASGVGLEPPPSMRAATTFNGFQNGLASIVITELPKVAYAQIDPERATFATRFASTGAVDVDINGARGFLVKGSQAVGTTHYRKWILVLDGAKETAVVSAQVPADNSDVSDAAMDAALKTIVFRDRPSLEQQVAALPFAVGDLAGFRVSGAALGAALILVDGPKDSDPKQTQAHVIVAETGHPPPSGDRAEFAKAQLSSFQAVRTSQIQSAKLFDANGSQWARVDATGSEGPDQTPIAITYFVRFGGIDVSIICISPQADAPRYAQRFETLSLSVTPKG